MLVGHHPLPSGYAPAAGANGVFTGDPYIVQRQRLGVAEALPHLVLFLVQDNPRSVYRDNDRQCGSPALFFHVHPAEHQDPFGKRHSPVAAIALRTVDHPLVTFHMRGGFKNKIHGVNQQGAGDATVWLCCGKRRQAAFSINDLAHKRHPMLGTAKVQQGRQGNVVDMPGGGIARVTGSQLLQDDQGGKGIQPGAAHVGGNDHLMKSLFKSLPCQFKGHRRFGIRLLVEFHGHRLDFILSKLADHVLVHQLLFA